MVLKCCCIGCNEKAVKGRDVTFHSFPKDESVKKHWLLNIKRDFTPSQYHKVCSKHFEEACFDRDKLGGTWLKKGAVPTIFDFSMELSPEKGLRGVSKKRKTLATEEKILRQMIQAEEIEESSIDSPETQISNPGPSQTPDDVALASLLAEGFYDVPFTDTNVRGGSVKIPENPSTSEVASSNGTKVLNKPVKRSKRGREVGVVVSEEGLIVLDSQRSKRFGYIGDFDESDMYDPELAIKALRVAKRQHTAQKNILRKLKRENRKLRKKVSSLSILNGDWTSDEHKSDDNDNASDNEDESGFRFDCDGLESSDSQYSSGKTTKKNQTNIEIRGAEQDHINSRTDMDTEIVEDNVFSLRPTLEEIRKQQSDFVKERNWEQYHQPRNLLLALVGEVGELSEIFQWRGEVQEGLPGWSDEEREHLGQELSDVLLYLIRLSEKCHIDLPAAVVRKMALNAQKYPASQVYGSSRKYSQYGDGTTDQASSA